MSKFEIGQNVVFKDYERPERTATLQNYSHSYGLEVAIKQRKPLEVIGVETQCIQVYDPESKLGGDVDPKNFELYEPQATQSIGEATDYPKYAFDGYVAQLKDSFDTYYPSDMFYAYSESTSVAGTKYTKHHLVSSVSKARIYKDKLTAQRVISKMNNASNLYNNKYTMRYVSYDPKTQMYTLHKEQSTSEPEVKDSSPEFSPEMTEELRKTFSQTEDDLSYAEGKMEALLEENKELKERLEGNEKRIDDLTYELSLQYDKKKEYKHKLELAMKIIAKHKLQVDGKLLAELLKVKDV